MMELPMAGPGGRGQMGPWGEWLGLEAAGWPRLGVHTAPAGESHITLPPQDAWKQARAPRGSPCPAGGLPEVLESGTTAQVALASS